MVIEPLIFITIALSAVWYLIILIITKEGKELPVGKTYTTPPSLKTTYKWFRNTTCLKKQFDGILTLTWYTIILTLWFIGNYWLWFTFFPVKFIFTRQSLKSVARKILCETPS